VRRWTDLSFISFCTHFGYNSKLFLSLHICIELFLFIKLSKDRNRNKGRRIDTFNFFNKKIKRKYFFHCSSFEIAIFWFHRHWFLSAHSHVRLFFNKWFICVIELWSSREMSEKHKERKSEGRRKKSLMRKIFLTLCGPENFLSASYHFPFDFPFPKSATQLSHSFVLWLDLRRIHLMPLNWWW